MEIDPRVDEFVARQYGVLSRAQALSTGMTDEMIQRRVASGRWIRLVGGVYAYASPPKWERQVAAAVLSRPGAVVGGRSAAWLHGFEGIARSKPEILVPDGGSGRSTIARLIRDAHIDRIPTTRVAGFEVTTIPETIWTLASRLPLRSLERLVDFQLAARRLAIGDFDAILDRINGERRPGGPNLRSVLASTEVR